MAWYLKMVSECLAETSGDLETVMGAIEILQFCVSHAMRLGFRMRASVNIQCQRRYFSQVEKESKKTFNKDLSKKLVKLTTFRSDLFNGKLDACVAEMADERSSYKEVNLPQRKKDTSSHHQTSSSSQRKKKQGRGSGLSHSHSR